MASTQLIPSLSTVGYHGHYDSNNQTLNDPIFNNLVLDYKPRTDIPVQLEYVPDSCRIVDYYSRNIKAMKSCVNNQTVCMWGDSHIITLHNTLAAWESGEYTAYDKEPAKSPFSTYYLKELGESFSQQLQECPLYFRPMASFIPRGVSLVTQTI